MTSPSVYDALGLRSFVPEPVPLGELKLAEYNPREMPEEEMEKLVRSIAEFGIVEPGVGRRSDLLVIGGHQRAAAARLYLQRKGATPEQIDQYPFPMVLIDITDHDAKLLNLALNKIQGQWDYKKLALVFDSIKEMTEERKTLSAFSTVEIDDVMALMGPGLRSFDNHGTGSSSSEGGDGDGSGEPEDDVDAMLARQARKFSFEVATDAEAETAKAALEAYGMSGPKTAGTAFARVCAAAMANQPAEKPWQAEATPARRTRKRKAKEQMTEGPEA